MHDLVQKTNKSSYLILKVGQVLISWYSSNPSTYTVSFWYIWSRDPMERSTSTQKQSKPSTKSKGYQRSHDCRTSTSCYSRSSSSSNTKDCLPHCARFRTDLGRTLYILSVCSRTGNGRVSPDHCPRMWWMCVGISGFHWFPFYKSNSHRIGDTESRSSPNSRDPAGGNGRVIRPSPVGISSIIGPCRNCLKFHTTSSVGSNGSVLSMCTSGWICRWKGIYRVFQGHFRRRSFSWMGRVARSCSCRSFHPRDTTIGHWHSAGNHRLAGACRAKGRYTGPPRPTKRRSPARLGKDSRRTG